MTDKTRLDLQNRVLSILSADGGSGQSAAAEDLEKVDELIDPVVDQLSADEVVTIDPDAIETKYFLALAGLVANAAAPDFSQAFDPNKQRYYEGELRRLNRAGPTYEVQSTDYY